MGLIDQIKGWFKTPFDHDEAVALYRAVVAQSRLPVFYRSFDVADTPDGRYDLLAMHAFMVMRRLKSGDAAAVELSQALHDLMFADMDQSLREMGIGDHGMPKRIKKLAEGFRGRIVAYDAGLEAAASGATDDLEAALVRNLYRKTEPSATAIRAMAVYMVAQDRHLALQPVDEIASGTVGFLAPDSDTIENPRDKAAHDG